MVRKPTLRSLKLNVTTLLILGFLSVTDSQAQTARNAFMPRGAQTVARSVVKTPDSQAIQHSTKAVSQELLSAPSLTGTELGPPVPPTAEAMPPAPVASSVMAEPYQPSTYANSPPPFEIPTYDDNLGYPGSETAFPNGGGYGCDASGCDAMGCDAVSGGCNGNCGTGCYHWIDTLSAHIGVDGFKNGFNRGQSGSFGFQQGVNWGSPLVFAPLGMNTQIGFRATQSEFHGNGFTTDSRQQYFFTTGLFKRNCQGMQGGIVFDYLHDDWYTQIDLAQVRGELSLGAPNGYSLGFAFSQSLSDDDSTTTINGQSVTESWETQDYYTLFWQAQSSTDSFGKLRIFGGATGEGDAIVGTQLNASLVRNWSLQSGFTYLIPNEGAAEGGSENEAWNVAINLVWYPSRSMGRTNRAMLPMFDVAGNGSMITRRSSP